MPEPMLKLRPIAVLLLLSCARLLLAQSAELSGIAHVAFRVSDIDRSRAFYARLGFEQAFEFTENGRVTQAFLKVNDRQFIELYPRAQESQQLGLTHVCYEAGDIQAVHAVYVQRGLNPPEVKKARAGNLLFVLHDPEGQVVEYTQYLPGSLHSEDQGKHLGKDRISTHLEDAAIGVKDVAAERAFYSEKLGFENAEKKGGRVALRIPGSNDELELEPADSAEASQISFAAEDLKRTRKVLRKLGFSPAKSGGGIQITDPDGNMIVFVPAR